MNYTVSTDIQPHDSVLSSFAAAADLRTPNALTPSTVSPEYAQAAWREAVLSFAGDHFAGLTVAEQARLRATAILQNALVLTDPHLPDNPIIYANSAFIELSGYPEEQIVGFSCRCLQGPKTDRAEVARLREAIQEQRPVQVTLLNYRKDGTTFWNELTVAPVRNDQGEVTHFVGVQTDVTALKTVEAELRQSEEELHAVVDQAMDGIYLLDLCSLRLIKTNAAFRNMLDYSEEEAGTLTLYDIIAHNRASIDRNVKALARDREASLGERQYLRRDGSVIIAEVSARIIHYGGSEAYCVVVHDMTGRRRAEAARLAAEEGYRSLFENADEGIFQTTSDGRYLQANPALAHIYGYETPEQMIAGLTDISGQLYREPERRSEFQRLMHEEGSVSGFESQVYRRDGSIIWISESARPVFDRLGMLRWYEGFVEDISDRKALEAQQAEALQEAQERADRDPLTGLLNHRTFYRRLEEETARAEREGTILAVIMLDLDNFKFFNDVYGHIRGDRVLGMVADKLQSACRSYDVLARFGGDEFSLLLPNIGHATRSEIEARLRTDLSGLLFYAEGEGTSFPNTPIPITVTAGAALFAPHGLPQTSDLHDSHGREVLRQAEERLRFLKTGGLIEAKAQHVRAEAQDKVKGFSMLDALVTAVDNKDRYTRKHSEDVMNYSLMIAGELGLDPEMMQTVAVAALLHDVGKIGVPDAILRKPGKLTEEEFAAIQQHPMMGAVMVGAVPGLEKTLDAVRHHHERWDGGGYPFGLCGEEIPVIARLMAVADAYSAMTTDRPYRKGMEPAKAAAILEAGAGSQWNAECVQAFKNAQSDTPHG